MSTLGDLKAQIADDLARSDLGSQIGAAITSAIRHFGVQRFPFNETRTTTFDTVAGQSVYDAGDIGELFFAIDAMYVTDSGGTVFPMGPPEDPLDLQWLLGTGAASGRPTRYGRYAASIMLYPEPDDVYTITPMGHIFIEPPTTDDEITDWTFLTVASELIRHRALWDLYANTIKSTDKAITQGGPNGEGGLTGVSLSSLRTWTNRQQATGSLSRTSF